MKKYVLILCIFLVSFFVYFGIATNFTFKPKWALDYINPLSQSLLQLRLDIPNPASTYDLVFFNGKWFAPWGILPSLFLIPIQLVMGRFVPSLYLSLFFASLGIVLVYFLLHRIKREFFPNMTEFSILAILALYALGTTHLYVGTLGSVWHVGQMVSNFFGTAGIYVIFKKKRTLWDYFLSTSLFSVTLLGRTTIAFLVFLPIVLFLFEHRPRKMFYVFGIPLLLMSSLFFFINYARFNNPLEYGYSFINEAPYLANLRQTYGAVSINNIPRNLWYIFAETPSITFTDKPTLLFNLKGNSIFFLTPPFLAIFLASWFQKKGRVLVWNPYVISLWVTLIITLIPTLLYYSSGWMQFGYRYTLDVTLLLLILSVFGIAGKISFLYILGIAFSIIMYQFGIRALS